MPENVGGAAGAAVDENGTPGEGRLTGVDMFRFVVGAGVPIICTESIYGDKDKGCKREWWQGEAITRTDTYSCFFEQNVFENETGQRSVKRGDKAPVGANLYGSNNRWAFFAGHN